MAVGDSVEYDLPAGDFSSWLQRMQATLGGDAQADVPCGECTGCCASAQFVHIGPEETEALAHIPDELLFPAPAMAEGHVLLGYDEQGRCPMLVDNGCSIYEFRPETCRSYDCRIFPAAGVELDEPDKEPIARRARRWRFDHPTELDRVEHGAVRAAARFVREHRDELPAESRPRSATGIAIAALAICGTFVGVDADDSGPHVVTPNVEEVRVAIGRQSPG